MARRHLWRNDVVRSYWRTRHPLLRFLCLHEAVTLPFVVAISDPTYLFAIIHLHFGDCLSGTSFSSRWSAMEYRRCQPPCARFHRSLWPAQISKIICFGFTLVIPRPGVRMFSWRRRRVSRQASPFSPSLTRACARKFTGWIHAGLSVS